jgi:uncharacterized protein (UPF0335 family)
MSNIGDNTSGHLKSFIERIEKLEDEKSLLAEDIRSVYKEAKDGGFEPKVLRAVVRRRAQDAEKVKQFEDELDSYLHALGMI